MNDFRLAIYLVAETQRKQKCGEYRKDRESFSPIRREHIREALEMEPDDVDAGNARNAQRMLAILEYDVSANAATLGVPRFLDQRARKARPAR